MISTLILSGTNQQVLESYIRETDGLNFIAHTDNAAKLQEALKELDKTLLFVDLDFLKEDFDYIGLLTGEYKNLRVVTFSQKPSVDLTVKSFRAGAAALLSVPFIKSEFSAAIAKVCSELENNSRTRSKCRFITIFSNKGGIGKTSIASNLALELAKITKEEVALIDLNFHLGDVTTFLDLKPTFDISYVINNLDKINSEFLLNTLERYPGTSLHILADPPYLKAAESITNKQLEKLFQLLEKTFSYVVIDTSAGLDEKTINVLKKSDLTFLVTVANLPALRNCQRCIDIFSSQIQKTESIQVIINRYMENDEIGVEDIEKLLGRDIFAKIPNNYFTMMSAINKGVPVSAINCDSNVALAYKSLALKVSDFVYRKKINEG